MHTVDIIVVNWNSGEQTLHAVNPYLNYKSDHIFCNVIVVDNGSKDGSVELLRKHLSLVIENESNLGFARACNIALPYCIGDFILLLNPDTRSEPFVLEQHVFFLEQDIRYAIAGPGQFTTNNKRLRSCGRFPNFRNSLSEVTGLSKAFPYFFRSAHLMLDWDHEQSRQVDHVMGSYMVIRRSVLNKTGFMDDNYFVYYEDLDLSKRLNDIGFKTYYQSELAIYHEAGSTGYKENESRLYYSLVSRRIYWRKHFKKIEVLILSGLSYTIEPVLRIIEALFRKRSTTVKDILKAYGKYLKIL